MPKVSIKQLREIEWEGSDCDCACCPVCGGLNPADMPPMDFSSDREIVTITSKYDHKAECWLAEMLKDADKALQED